MIHEVKKIKSLKSDSQAGLPNAGPMAAEDCLAANIRQNKVPIYENLFSSYCLYPSPVGEGDRRVIAGVAGKGETSVPLSQ